MDSNHWLLCLSKLPTEEEIKVKILAPGYEPIQGEELQLLSSDPVDPLELERIRRVLKDQELISFWRRRVSLFYNYGTVFMDDGERRSIVRSEYLEFLAQQNQED